MNKMKLTVKIINCSFVHEAMRNVIEKRRQNG